jgi:hypothetical protein
LGSSFSTAFSVYIASFVASSALDVYMLLHRWHRREQRPRGQLPGRGDRKNHLAMVREAQARVSVRLSKHFFFLLREQRECGTKRLLWVEYGTPF